MQLMNKTRMLQNVDTSKRSTLILFRFISPAWNLRKVLGWGLAVKHNQLVT